MGKKMDLEDVRWDRYPAVAGHGMARRWIETQVLLGMAPNTVDAYARGVQDFLAFCEEARILATEASRDQIAGYVGDLRRRPNPRTVKTLLLDSQVGLSNATLQQRLTAVRMFYDLGHGLCGYEFFEQCPHRLACPRCDFYQPKESSLNQLLEAQSTLLRLMQEIPLSQEERAAVDGDLVALHRLTARLADQPTPSGQTPKELGQRATCSV